MKDDGPWIYTVNYSKYRLISKESETFRCGKTVTTVVLRELGGDSELTITTSKEWKQVLGASYLKD